MTISMKDFEKIFLYITKILREMIKAKKLNSKVGYSKIRIKGYNLFKNCKKFYEEFQVIAVVFWNV